MIIEGQMEAAVFSLILRAEKLCPNKLQPIYLLASRHYFFQMTTKLLGHTLTRIPEMLKGLWAKKVLEPLYLFATQFY